MGRGPVFHQRRGAVPSLAAVEAFEVTAARETGLDEVPFLGALRHPPHHVARLSRLAEGTAKARGRPGAATEMTGQPPASVFHEVTVGRHPTAPRAEAALPATRGKRAHAGEPHFEGGSEARVSEKPREMAGKAQLAFRTGSALSVRRKQRGGADRPRVPGRREAGKGRSRRG